MAARGRKKVDPFDVFFTKVFIRLAVVVTALAIVWALISESLKALGPIGVRLVFGVVVAGAGAWLWSHYRGKQRLHAERVARAIWQAERDRHLPTADVMSGTEFEHLVKRLLIRDGFTDVRVAGGAGDRAADVIAQSPRGHRVVVQCKRYGATRSVRSAEMQLFIGVARYEHKAEHPLYVTTSRYTKQASALAAKHGIYLIGRYELGKWMSGSTAFAAAQAPTIARS